MANDTLVGNDADTIYGSIGNIIINGDRNT